MTSAVASKEYKLLSGSSTESATVSTLEKSYSIDSKMVSVSSTESSIIKDSTVSLVKSLSSLAGVSIEMTHSTEYKFASEYTAGLNFESTASIESKVISVSSTESNLQISQEKQLSTKISTISSNAAPTLFGINKTFSGLVNFIIRIK